MPFIGQTRRGDGEEIPPGAGVVPVLREIGDRQLKVVGTGFFVTRYGLFASARHVLDELADWDTGSLRRGFILQADGERLYIRQIVGISISRAADVAVGQADNGIGRDVERLGPPNLRAPLSLVRPSAGEELGSFAYPENEILDFRDPAVAPRLVGDYVFGRFEAQVPSRERPYIPYPHYETSLRIRSGASGCPIFNSSGRVVGIACRGWDFSGGEHDGDELSSILPVTQLLPIEVGCARIPPDSWEYREIPEARRGAALTFAELVTYGHVDVGAL
jgi:hypothetical protein